MKKFTSILLVLGFIMLILGLYFRFFESGILRVDTWEQITKRVEFFLNTGFVLIHVGFLVMAVGALALLLTKKR